jgi:hypothetical protein
VANVEDPWGFTTPEKLAVVLLVTVGSRLLIAGGLGRGGGGDVGGMVLRVLSPLVPLPSALVATTAKW